MRGEGLVWGERRRGDIEGRKRKGEPQRERKFEESDTEGEGKVGQKMGRKESSDSYTYSLVPRLPIPVFLQWEEPGYEAKSCTRVGHMAWNILCVFVCSHSHMQVNIWLLPLQTKNMGTRRSRGRLNEASVPPHSFHLSPLPRFFFFQHLSCLIPFLPSSFTFLPLLLHLPPSPSPQESGYWWRQQVLHWARHTISPPGAHDPHRRPL